MAAQHGGIYQDKALQGYISQVGERIVKKSAASGSPYPFEFYLFFWVTLMVFLLICKRVRSTMLGMLNGNGKEFGARLITLKV